MYVRHVAFLEDVMRSILIRHDQGVTAPDVMSDMTTKLMTRGIFHLRRHDVARQVMSLVWA